MNATDLIPMADTVPVSPYFFWVLGILTFTIHILLVNVFLGGSIITVVNRWKQRDDDPDVSFHGAIAGKIPVVIALAINFGVAPLLFLQVIYGHLYYTSSVIMAVFYIVIIPLLIIAYYAAYIHKIKYTSHVNLSFWALAVLVVIALYIGFMLSNNLTMMVLPESWKNYFTSRSGTFLNLANPVLYPRFLHFITASVAIGGLFLAIVWRYRARKQGIDADDKIRKGLTIFGYASLVQICVGIWFLVSLPRDFTMQFLGGTVLYTVILFIAVLAALGAIAMSFMNRLMPTVILISVTVFFMSVTRANLRMLETKEYFTFSQLKITPQYSVMAVFLIVLAAGIALIWYMVKISISKKQGRAS